MKGDYVAPNGQLRIDHREIDRIIKADLTLSAMRLILAIADEALGWERNKDSTTQRQGYWELRTGIPSKHIGRALQELEKAGFIQWERGKKSKQGEAPKPSKITYIRATTGSAPGGAALVIGESCPTPGATPTPSRGLDHPHLRGCSTPVSGGTLQARSMKQLTEAKDSSLRSEPAEGENSVSIADVPVEESEPGCVIELPEPESNEGPEFQLEADIRIPSPQPKNSSPEAPAAQSSRASKAKRDSAKPKGPGNVWQMWIDIHRDHKLPDPVPSGPDTKASGEIGRMGLSDEEIIAILRLFRRDEDKWLKNQGHALRHLPGRMNKYCQRYAQIIRERAAEEKRAQEELAAAKAREEKLASMTPEQHAINDAACLLCAWWLEQIAAKKAAMNKTIWEDCNNSDAILLARFGPNGDLKKQIRRPV